MGSKLSNRRIWIRLDELWVSRWRNLAESANVWYPEAMQSFFFSVWPRDNWKFGLRSCLGSCRLLPGTRGSCRSKPLSFIYLFFPHLLFPCGRYKHVRYWVRVIHSFATNEFLWRSSPWKILLNPSSWSIWLVRPRFCWLQLWTALYVLDLVWSDNSLLCVVLCGFDRPFESSSYVLRSRFECSL